MTKQQIKQMMHESKAIEWFDSENMDWLEYVNVFDRFASLIVAAEREACAKVVERMGIAGYGTLAIALAIRVRREE